MGGQTITVEKTFLKKSTNTMCGSCLDPDLNKLQKDIYDINGEY